MPIFNQFRGTTALVALLALAAPQVMAQDNTGTSGSGSDTPAAPESAEGPDGSLTDAVNDAPAPATDGTNQTQGAGTTGSSQGNTPGDVVVAPGDMNIQNSMTNQNAGQTVMLDIEGFAQQIYERGFRQGYVSGVSDTRQQVMEQVRARRMQMQQMQGGQAATGNQPPADTAGGSGSDEPQNPAQAGGDEPISDEVAARPGGSIIVLPPGVSPEAFIEQITRQNQQ